MNDRVDGLPTDWIVTKLEEIAEATLGKTPRRADYRDNGKHRIVKYRDLKSEGIDFGATRDAFVVDDAVALAGLRELRAGDVLIGASGHDGSTIGRKIALVEELPGDEPVFFVGEIFRIRPRSVETDSRWLLHYFSSEAGYRALQRAVAGGHLTNGRARQIELPLAPSATQKQLADLLDSVRGMTLSSAKRLRTARVAIERFGQSILAAACSGRLTADWRKEHDHSSTSHLLSELRANRQKATGRKAPVPSPDTTELDELPTSWAWAAVGEIGEVQIGGTPSRKEASYWKGQVPWVSSGEVANCRISNTRETITEAGLANSSAKLYPVGTVLIAMIGEGKTRGQSAILDIEASTNQNAAGILPNREIAKPEYVWRWALAQYEVTRAVGRGGNQPALNGEKVRELAIPIPPLEEQREIVRRVDRLMALADGLELRVELALTRLERSSQAVLDKAFRGDLT